MSTNDATWTFLSNHAHVLVCVARDPTMRMRDIAVAVGITERAVQKVLTDLEQARVIRRVREGRRNRYEIDARSQLRHPLEAARTVADLLGAMGYPTSRRRAS
jgi:DNA-binding MarR family transcriptional regulator